VTRVLAALAALAPALAGAAPALAQSRCPGILPTVTYQLDMKPAEISHERSQAELRNMSNRRTASHPIGLYVTRLAGGPRIDVATTRVEERDCVAVSKVDILFEMRTRSIFIARELERGSCTYRVTLAHERQHEQIDEDQIRRQLPSNVQNMRYDFSNLATSAPVRANERDQIVRAFRERAQEIVDRMLERLFEERERAQLAIDTPQEYARLASLCR
jgi:hypothetical protein